MSKRVHFAPTTLVYSTLPSIRSPVGTSSSLVPHARQNQWPVSDPAVKENPAAEGIQVHFLLAFSRNNPPSVQYDLSLPPQAITTMYSLDTFFAPATSPALQRLSIYCPRLDWFIPVSGSLPGGIISVLDVLCCIYRGLRAGIQAAEYHALPSPEAAHIVNMAYLNRCAFIVDDGARSRELLKGVKKVDFLMGRTRFGGLSSSKTSRDVWVLNVS